MATVTVTKVTMATSPVAHNAIQPAPSVGFLSMQDLLAQGGLRAAVLIAMYAVIAAFPLVLLPLGVAASVVNPQWAVERIGQAVSPELAWRLAHMVRFAIAERGVICVVAACVLMGAASCIFAEIAHALAPNGSEKIRPALSEAISSAVIKLTIAVLIIFSIAGVPALALLPAVLGPLPFTEAFALHAAQSLAPGTAFFGGACLLYRLSGVEPAVPAMTGAIVPTAMYFILHAVLLSYTQSLNVDNLVGAAWILAAGGILTIWLLTLGLLFGGKLAWRISAQRG